MAQDSMIAWKRNRKPLGFGSEERAVEAGDRTRAQEGFKKAAGPLWAVAFTLSLAFLAACLFVSYCRWAWWDTHEVMQDIWRTMQSEPIAESEALDSDDIYVRLFAPHYLGSSNRVVFPIAVDRAFTWVWGDEGKVWLATGGTYLKDSPDELDYPSRTRCDTLSIRKVDGRWRIVDADVRSY